MTKSKLLKIKKDILALSIALSTLSLTACGESTQNKNEVHKAENELGNYKSDEDKVRSDELRETTVLEVGQHYIFKRIVIDNVPQEIKGGGFYNVPEGYEVFTINNFNIHSGQGSRTNGYDIWFVNTKPVTVKAVYSSDYDNYGYYDFGTVVEEKKLTK